MWHGRLPCAPAAAAGRAVREEGPGNAGHVAGAPQESGRHAVAARRLEGPHLLAHGTAVTCSERKLLIQMALYPGRGCHDAEYRSS